MIGVGSEVGIDLAEGNGDRGPIREAGLVRSHRPAGLKGLGVTSVFSAGALSGYWVGQIPLWDFTHSATLTPNARSFPSITLAVKKSGLSHTSTCF